MSLRVFVRFFVGHQGRALPRQGVHQVFFRILRAYIRLIG
jgi:hypothetical protein